MVVQINARIEGVDKTLKALERKLGQLKNQPKMAPMRKRWSIYQLNQYRKNFISGGDEVGGWKQISPLTILLRAGISQKITSFEQAEKLAAKAKPLQDTGRLRDSFVPGKTGNVNKALSALAIEIGTNVDYADRVHKGGMFPFRFDSETRRRFARSVPKKVGGQINKFHGSMLRHFEKKDGQATSVPARPIIYRPTPRDKRQLEQITRKVTDKLLRGEL